MGSAVKMVVHNGVRYRPEDAARLGLDQDPKADPKPAKKPRAPRGAKAETKIVEPPPAGDGNS